ncbi:tripartite tricarboxylate transporter TctB family protein [Martelella endophytica]|uniref:DUF1468 domain-containing protein n=1 Tax=Martelella endophytica TaxID=1486262 RepID=A0A0D5LMD2_MAREN|nr:tripartite tricarboxylate transporter TctB family protein [Martelella endophytica]AJY44917.1 hypothetical protein TM49_03195 [Martelella endophytica]
MRADRAIGAAILLFALATFYFATHIDVLATSGAITPRSLPMALAIVIGAGGLFLLIRPGSLALRAALAPIVNRHALAFMALLLIYGLSFRHVDFRLGVWLFMLLSMALLGERRPTMLAIVPIAVAASVFLIFRYGFTVLVPAWI